MTTLKAKFTPAFSRDLKKKAGRRGGSNECPVANAGDWLVIWRTDGDIAYFQRTGSHDELFR